MRLQRFNKALKAYDRELFAQELKLGRIDVYRKSAMNVSPPYFLFSLTDSWKPEGVPVDYGVEVVLNRVKAHDLWRDDTFAQRWMAEDEKIKDSEARARKNSMESFFYDFRSEFKKTFTDVNTSLMSKERAKLYGNC